MRYLGGKARLAKHIVKAIIDDGGMRQTFVEPFVGGFNLVPHLPETCSRKICADIHEGLITMYRAIQSGWDIPEEMPRERHATLKCLNDWEDPETAFAAFGCSFGGREWGSYASGGADGRNYAANARNSLLKKKQSMTHVEFLHSDYRSLHIPSGSLVYCDPPYKDAYGYKTGDFDHDAFYVWCESLDCPVYVSEFTAPDHWHVIWEKERKVTLNDGRSGKPYATKTDRLYKVRTP